MEEMEGILNGEDPNSIFLDMFFKVPLNVSFFMSNFYLLLL
jgi:hypothetical protein